MATTNNNPSTSSGSSSANVLNNTTTITGGDSRWYFTNEQLGNSPSRRQGIDADQELSFRQLTAYLIQEMGQRLQVSQLCINTAIVYMHRFYAFHSFTHFHRNGIAAASLFLAAKVEEQPRKLEHVIKAAHMCLNQEPPQNTTEMYAEQAQDLVFNENVLLQTLGFDVAIDHPHTHVVKTCHLVKACKDLAQTSYFLASNSLHLTSMCLQYRPTVVACFCIYLACKWSRWEIPQSTEGKHWFHYVDKTVTMDLLKQLTDEFIAIYEKSPARLKSKLNSIKALAQGARIPEPSSRNMSESSNGSNSSQLEQLTPVPMQPQTQQQATSSSSTSSSRRPDALSNHHRSLHGNVQHPHHHHHHHHHSKHSTAIDAVEHKQKQPYPNTSGTSHSIRPRSDRANQQQQLVSSGVISDANSQYSSNKQLQQQLSSSSSSSKLNNSNVGSSGRSAQVSLPIIPPLMQQQTTMGATGPSSSTRQNLATQQIHDANYHKNRSGNNVASNLPNQVNSQLSINHKTLPSKNQIESSNRNAMKDSSSGRIDSNKMSVKQQQQQQQQHVPSSNSASTVYSQPQIGVDTSRNMIQQQQQQKPYIQNAVNSNLQLPNSYQQQQSSSRGNSSTGNTNSSNVNSNLSSSNKYDQSVQQQPLSQKQSLESSSFQLNSSTTSANSSFSQISSQLAAEQTEICSPTRYSTGQTNQQQQQSQQNKSFSSIFSPGWNEKQQITNQNSNNSKSITFNNKPNRDSPKKSDKKSGTPKKEKRSEHQQSQSDKRSSKNSSISANQNLIQMNIGYPSSSQQSDIHQSANKRQKVEDDLIRDSKIRKIDVDVKPIIDHQQHTQNQSSSIIQDFNKPPKFFPLTSINGIETNPDLVSSLLKESLCNENKFSSQSSLAKNETQSVEQATNISTNFIKTEPKLSPLQSGFNINPMETLPQQLLQDTSNQPSSISIKTEPIASASTASSNVSSISQSGNIILHQQQLQDDYVKIKSEKKKKKDKHKHKEKDKSKDKEERKKHKKDKDKHKERERLPNAGSELSEPVKLKISKDKINLPPGEAINVSPGQLKIKIPKDRIKTELGGTDINLGQQIMQQTAIPQQTLKIKISKDKVETFGQDLSGGGGSSSSSMTSLNPYGVNSSAFAGSNISGISMGSNKKKDRDRDRDKDKKRNNSDLNRQNGGNSGGGMSGTTSSSKSQSTSSKMHYTHSQLFGESNDDDDSDDDTNIQQQQIHHKTAYSHNTSTNRINEMGSNNSYLYSENNKKYNNYSNNNTQHQHQYQYQQNYNK